MIDPDPPAVIELKALAVSARAAAEHYRLNPTQVSPAVVIDLYYAIARLARLAARCNVPPGREGVT